MPSAIRHQICIAIAVACSLKGSRRKDHLLSLSGRDDTVQVPSVAILRTVRTTCIRGVSNNNVLMNEHPIVHGTDLNLFQRELPTQA